MEELIVYVMLYCLRPTLQPRVEVCHIAHIYTKQSDCDLDAARLARIPANLDNGTKFRCSSPVKVKTEQMPKAWTQ